MRNLLRLLPAQLSVVVIALVLCASVQGCKPILVSSQEKVTTKTTVTEEEKDVFVRVPEKKIQFEGNVSVTPRLIFLPGKNSVKRIYVEKYSADSLLYMKTEIDSMGRITMECMSLGYDLQTKVKVLNTLTEVQRETIQIYKERENKFKKLLVKIGIGLLILLIIAMVVLRFYSKITTFFIPK